MSRSTQSRWGLRFLGLGYIAVLLIAPLILLFYKTFEDGLAAPFEAITSSDGLVAIIRSYRPGDEVTVTYERGGSTHTVQATLDSDAETTNS